MYAPLQALINDMAAPIPPRTHPVSMGVAQAEAALAAARRVIEARKCRTLADFIAQATTNAEALNRAVLTRKDERGYGDIDSTLTFEASIPLHEWPTTHTEDICEAVDRGAPDAARLQILDQTDAVEVESLEVEISSYPNIGVHGEDIVISFDAHVTARVRVG